MQKIISDIPVHAPLGNYGPRKLSMTPIQPDALGEYSAVISSLQSGNVIFQDIGGRRARVVLFHHLTLTVTSIFLFASKHEFEINLLHGIAFIAFANGKTCKLSDYIIIIIITLQLATQVSTYLWSVSTLHSVPSSSTLCQPVLITGCRKGYDWYGYGCLDHNNS